MAITRRALLRGAAGASGLVIAASIPAAVKAAGQEVGHSYQCGAPFGPLHQYLFATSPDPWWADAIIWRESNWEPSATNPSSAAAGLCQFMWSTWNWGQERFGIYGSPYDGITAIRMMNAFLRAGEYYHWSL